MADVFLDLWGVLADSRKMTPAHRLRASELLESRHGGSTARWLRAIDVAGAWYGAHMDDPATWETGTWVEVVNRADAEHVSRMFREAGAVPPADPLGFSKAFTLEVMSMIDSAFPDARIAIARLRKAGHRVYVSTGATEDNARGTLAGARLLGELDGVFTGESQNASKADPAYWRRIAERVPTDPPRAFVVDDRTKYLKAAASVGFPCLFLDRDGSQPPAAMPPFVSATLRNLAGLPQYVDDAVRAARAQA